MPSSKKTPNLRLNRWLGSDKPKKDDFVEDNLIIDQMAGSLQEQVARAMEELKALQGSLEAIQSSMDSGTKELRRELLEQGETLTNQMEGMKGNLTGLITTAQSTVDTHKNNGIIHVTQTQKNAWDGCVPTVGSYVGDGSGTRKIPLGYSPKAGMVFAQGEPITKTVWSGQSCNVWGAFFSSVGAGGGVAVQSDGFTVTYNVNNTLEGFAYKLNAPSTTYLYVVWR